MTPTQIKDSVRNQVYETSASFWSDAEIYTYLWFAECEIAGLIQCTEATDDTTTTVASTQEYAKPTDCLIVLRVTYDGAKLKRIDLTDQDALDGSAYGGSLSTGNANSYYEFGDNVGLYPIPDDAKTLKFWYIKQPTLKTDADIGWDVPTEFEHYLADYALYRMYLKEQDEGRASIHKQLFDQSVARAAQKWRINRERDRHSVVKTEEFYPITGLGLV